jgi:adenosylhomocysteine nucleosidase
VFIAAIPREIAALVASRGWRADRTRLGRGIHLFEHQDAVVACAGMGAGRVSFAVEAALTLGPVQELISVGWAGACNPKVHVGDVLHPTIVIDARTSERFFLTEPDSYETPEILVTVPYPASALEKERALITYYASAVDMEAATVARLAHAHGLPFCSIKAISDDADFELPDLGEFTTDGGQIREAAFGFHVALRPRMWGSVLTLAKGSRLAAERLCAEIEVQINLYRDQRRDLKT